LKASLDLIKVENMRLKRLQSAWSVNVSTHSQKDDVDANHEALEKHAVEIPRFPKPAPSRLLAHLNKLMGKGLYPFSLHIWGRSL